MLAATLTSLTLVVDGRAEMATGLAATGDYFRVLGVQPAERGAVRGTSEAVAPFGRGRTGVPIISVMRRSLP